MTAMQPQVLFWGEMQAFLIISADKFRLRVVVQQHQLSPIAETPTAEFTPRTDSIAISTNGLQRLVVSTEGNVGIGISNPDDYAVEGEKIQVELLVPRTQELLLLPIHTRKSFILPTEQAELCLCWWC